MHVSTEQPGWRDPDSKCLPGKSGNSFLCSWRFGDAPTQCPFVDPQSPRTQVKNPFFCSLQLNNLHNIIYLIRPVPRYPGTNRTGHKILFTFSFSGLYLSLPGLNFEACDLGGYLCVMVLAPMERYAGIAFWFLFLTFG